MSADAPPNHIPPHVVNHLLRRLAVEFADRDEALGKLVGADVAQASARGALQSSALTLMVVGHYATEVRLRAQQARLCLQQTMAALGGSQHKGFAEAAMVVLRPVLAEQAAKLRASLLSQAPLRGMVQRRTADPQQRSVAPYLIRFEEALQTAETVLRLDLDEMEGAARQMADRSNSSNTANVTGNGNVVFVGVKAGDVSIRIDAAGREAIAAAMKEVLANLDQSGLPADKVTEVRELAEECAQAATQDKPNKTRLGASLKAISESIRTVAALQPAYRAVKDALAYLGLSGGT